MTDSSSGPRGSARARRRTAQHRRDTQRGEDCVRDLGSGRPGTRDREKAGVGIGTVYRHFPQRSDLIAAVFRREIDACADAAPSLRPSTSPSKRWLGGCSDTPPSLPPTRARPRAAFGQSGLRALPAYFEQRLRPAFRTLLKSAAAAGEVRADVDATIFSMPSRACACPPQ